MRTTNILIAAVGGQGGLTLSRVIATSAVIEGLDVRTGETLGMAQRFGSVISYVRIGSKIHSPLFMPGEADLIIGLELIETLRNLHYLNKKGYVIAAEEIKPPVSSSLGIAENPDRDTLMMRIRKNAKAIGGEVIYVPARELAIKAGNYRAMNMVLLGVANKKCSLFSDKNIVQAIRQVLPGEKGDISIKAYHIGKSFSS